MTHEPRARYHRAAIVKGSATSLCVAVSGVQEASLLNDKKDQEENRLTARAARYVRVGTNVGAVAARVASQRLFGLDSDDSKNAVALAAALGGLKGPIMKVAQLLATIPEALPQEYIEQLSKLQSQAPPMG